MPASPIRTVFLEASPTYYSARKRLNDEETQVIVLKRLRRELTAGPLQQSIKATLGECDAEEMEARTRAPVVMKAADIVTREIL